MNKFKQFRSLDIKSEQNDKKDEYRYTLTFASDEPVERWFGYEIVNPSLMDLSRLNNKSIVLFNHNFDKPIGVVEKAWVDASTNTAKADIRLDDTNEDAVKIKKSIDNKIISKVSFGYQYKDSKLVKEENNQEYYEFSTLPFEISIVTVPADDTVGVEEKRSFEQKFLKKENIKYNLNSNTTNQERQIDMSKKDIEDVKDETEEEVKDAVEDVEKDEVKEIDEEVEKEETEERSLSDDEINKIQKLGDIFNQRELANSFILDNKTEKEFRAELKNLQKTQVKQQFTTEREQKNMKSIAKTLQDAMTNNRSVQLNLRDFIGASKENAGKELVQNNTLAIQDFTNFEDYYRSFGFTVYKNAVGNLTVPYISDVTGGGVTGEGEAMKDGTIVSSNVTIPSRKFTIKLKFSPELIASTDEDIIGLIQSQALAKTRDAISQEILAELVNTSGIKTEQKDFTFTNLVNLQADVNTSGVKKYLTTRKTSVALKTTEAFSNTGKTVLENGHIDGVKVETIEKLPAGVTNEFVLFGDLSAHLVALYGEPTLYFNGYPDDQGLFEVKIISQYGSVLANKKAVSKLTTA